MNYKTTLRMPSTSFEMKANLNIKEPIFQKKWFNLDLEKLINDKNRNNEVFILHDGPPYANGDIHIGHGLNKILKDFIIRYKSGTGFYSPYIGGWDTHGMPIEIALQKKDKINDLSVFEKRIKCKEFATSWIEKQKSQFLSLGLLTKFDKIYRTFDKQFEVDQIKIFFKMLNDGLIYKDLKPIYWSWSSQTALAEAEVEYADVQSDSIYFTFKIHNSKILDKDDKLLIWTTTPWTIPSNLAIAIHPDFEYVKVKSDIGNIILIKEKFEELLDKLEIKFEKVLKEFKGKDLENDEYYHCLYPQKINKIILAKYVLSDNTGLVHNAPGFGNDDYLACKKYGINVYCPIDSLGKFTNECNDEELVGKFYIDTNPIIIDRLKQSNSLIQYKKITHSAAHDWRTKKPVIYRATDQWFVNLSKIKNNLVESLNKVSSKQGPLIIQKIKEMIENRQEWCISRQRYWGVPIPIIYDEKKQPITDIELQSNILKIFELEGTDSWYSKDVEYFLTAKYKNKKCYKEKDIMDVWFDSGTSHTIIGNLKFPADLYFEGKDQFRGWFNSSLTTSVAYKNCAPYKELLSHGFVLDSQGRKMSKSLGNVIKPEEILKKYGADVFRIWCASTDYTDDVRISNDILDQSSEIYRRIRNTIFKFILGNLNNFSEKDFSFNFSEADKLIIYKMNNMLELVHSYYLDYDFKNIIKTVNKMILELSTWYFEFIKDSLYCDEENNMSRRAIQTVLFHILKSFLTILSPIIPHTTEEAYEYFHLDKKEESVHLERILKKIEFPNVDLKIDNKKWDLFFDFKEKVFAKLEEARKNKIINQNNAARVKVKNFNTLLFDIEIVKKYLNVSELIIDPNLSDDIFVDKTENEKCERCWNFFSELVPNKNICNRCFEIVKNINKDN
ncbi:MAG: isoleucine--tRNA ligase [Mycoplasmoidaceae bacterium]